LAADTVAPSVLNTVCCCRVEKPTASFELHVAFPGILKARLLLKKNCTSKRLMSSEIIKIQLYVQLNKEKSSTENNETLNIDVVQIRDRTVSYCVWANT